MKHFLFAKYTAKNQNLKAHTRSFFTEYGVLLKSWLIWFLQIHRRDASVDTYRHKHLCQGLTHT